jgi:hypothetical protein
MSDLQCRSCSWSRVPTRAASWRCPRCLTLNLTLKALPLIRADFSYPTPADRLQRR